METSSSVIAHLQGVSVGVLRQELKESPKFLEQAWTILSQQMPLEGNLLGKLVCAIPSEQLGLEDTKSFFSAVRHAGIFLQQDPSEELVNLFVDAFVTRNLQLVDNLLNLLPPKDAQLLTGQQALLNKVLMATACFSSTGSVINRLINMGANQNAVDATGHTPLHRACYTGDINTIKLLLDRGANLEARNVYGSTPLYLVCRKGNIDAVKMLLERGANPEAKDEDESTPLHRATDLAPFI